MPTFEQGQVVRVPFPRTDRNTRQRRPALVVSNGGIGDENRLLWVAMITSAENPPWDGDHSIGDGYRTAGLPIPSIIRPTKVATIEANDAEAVGRIEDELLRAVLGTMAGLLGR